MESPGRVEMKPLTGSGVDREYLFRLYKQELEVHINTAFGWREEEQRNRFEASYPSHEVTIIFAASKVAGYLVIRNSPLRKHVALLLLEPAFQGLGLGTEIMKSIHAESLQSSQEVTLCSFKCNSSALSFYQGLGYRPISEDAAFVELRWDKESSNK